ncbi:MAG TPA: hypothetical protein DHW64_08440 [Chitinophagaceae bacterium]|nr:hypothetical protein [Chitinophagaceae bacterium]
MGRGDGIKILEAGEEVKLITKAVKMIGMQAMNNNIVSNRGLGTFQICYLLFSKHDFTKVGINFYGDVKEWIRVKPGK